ncbi:hypothetical protein HWV62_39116 [Athelia sp. TMB]|nr:hypothetical protein HWV62_39116 [Athelia sp. TMB]
MVILSPLQPPPWDSWELDPKFFKTLSIWTLTHPESSLDKIMDNVCTALESGDSVLQLIPDSPFPARSLIQALTYVLRLGISISTAKVAVQEFAQQIVQWVGQVHASFSSGSQGGRFERATRKNLSKIRSLIDEICNWAVTRLNDGRWSSIKHGLSISKEIDAFKTRITEARTLFVDLSVIEASKGMDIILKELEHVRRLQKDQLQSLHDKLDAQEQAREREQFLAQMLVTVANPTYNHQGKLPCDEGTRAEILAEIKEWIKDNSSTSQGFLWLSGDPGSGKSAITASIARDCKDDGTLWAQFFINRNSVETTDPKLYFPSIARQFIDHSSHPEVATAIHDAIKKRPTLVDDISSAQASKLFVDVLEVACRADPSMPVLVVIDGLDETSRSQLAATAEIFSQIFKSFSSRNAKVLISSRTDDDIRRPFASMMDVAHVKHVHLDTAAATSIRDVSIYLARRISRIVKDHDLNWEYWPGQLRMEMLCDRASGLFIWAVTVVKFFQDQINLLGTECLDNLLNTFSHEGMGDINALYSAILRIAYRKNSDPWVFQTFRRIVGCIVTVQEPLSIATIASILDLRRDPSSSPVDVLNFCRRLRTVLISGADAIDGETIPRLHKSFFEFITSTRVDTRYRVDLQYSNSELALKSILQLTTLGHQHSNDKVPFYSSQTVRYALQFWEPHLRAAVKYNHGFCIISDDLRDTQGELDMPRGTKVDPFGVLFTSNHIVLSFKNQMSAWKQTTQPLFFSPIEIGPTVECSAFAFSSDKQTAAFSVAQTIYIWVVSTGRIIQSMKDCTTGVKALAFSQDGQIIVASGPDCTLRAWDTGNGAQISFFLNTHPITAFEFAPDGKKICFCDEAGNMNFFDLASGELLGCKIITVDRLRHTIELSPHNNIPVSVGVRKVDVWDLKSKRKLHSFGSLVDDGPTHNSGFVVFSALGKYLVSFSDKNIFLWDTETGAFVRRFEEIEEFTAPICCAEFSPDEKYLVGGGNFNGVYLWNVQTGMLVGGKFVGVGDSLGNVSCAVTFTADGKHIMSGSIDGTVRMWEVRPYATCAGNISSTVLISSAILSASFDDNVIQLWDADNLLPLDVSLTSSTAPGFSILAVSPDESRIAALSTTGLVSLWDAGTRQLVCPPMRSNIEAMYSSLSLMFSSDNLRLTLASLDQDLCSWSTADGSPLSDLISQSPEKGEGPREGWFDLQNGWSGMDDENNYPRMSNGPGSLTILPMDRSGLEINPAELVELSRSDMPTLPSPP